MTRTLISRFIYFKNLLFICLFSYAGSYLHHLGSSIFTVAFEVFSCSLQTHLWHVACGMSHLVPHSRVEPGPSALGIWGLSHWTTREIPRIQTS